MLKLHPLLGIPGTKDVNLVVALTALALLPVSAHAQDDAPLPHARGRRGDVLRLELQPAGHPDPRPHRLVLRKELCMDLLYPGIALLFFGACFGLIALFESLQGKRS